MNKYFDFFCSRFLIKHWDNTFKNRGDAYLVLNFNFTATAPKKIQKIGVVWNIKPSWVNWIKQFI